MGKLRLALVFLNSLAHHLTADQNASVIANAQIIWLVSIRNAEIHAPELADRMQNVMLSVTLPYVRALRDILVIL